MSHREGTTSSTGGEREGAGDGGTIDEIFDPTNRERMKEEVKRRKKEGAPLGHDVAEGDTGAAVRRAMDAELRGRVGTGGQRDGER